MTSIFVYTDWEARLRPTKDKMEATISIVSERDLKPIKEEEEANTHLMHFQISMV
jgi:hypothetical protein